MSLIESSVVSRAISCCARISERDGTSVLLHVVCVIVVRGEEWGNAVKAVAEDRLPNLRSFV